MRGSHAGSSPRWVVAVLIIGAISAVVMSGCAGSPAAHRAVTTQSPSAPSPSPAAQAPVARAAVNPADHFQAPLGSWQPHCLGFGSQWRYCNGVALRACANGAVWLHTGVDIKATAGEPVMAAADGVIIGYLIDPQFHGGVLIRHQTSTGTVITQY